MLRDFEQIKGRKTIYTDYTKVDETNVIKVLRDSLAVHESNRQEIRFLLNYEKGIQPIIEREKDVRPEINIKLSENNAAKIVDFKIGYEFGSPVTYVQRAKEQIPESSEYEDDKKISYLNQMLYEENKSSKDIELARFFKICGVGYRLIRPKKDVEDTSVFDIAVLNPLTTFVVRSNDIYRKVVMSCTYSIKDNGETLYGCYTDDSYYEILNTVKIVNGEPSKNKEDSKWEIKNGYGKGVKIIPAINPIVEYVNDYDRMGCFEKVISILDRINEINSDRANDIAQHVQSFLWLNNCELEEGDTIKPGGLIMTKSPNNGVQANIKYLNDVLNQTEVQTYVDYLQEQAMQISGCPTKTDTGGGSTGSAMNLSTGYQTAESLAKASETIFERSERKSIKIMLKIIENSDDVDESLKGLKIGDILVKFSRNKTYDLATKCNALSTLLNAGIYGLRAIETVGLFTDPEQCWQDSREIIEKIQKKNSESNQNKQPNTGLQDMSSQTSKVSNVDEGV